MDVLVAAGSFVIGLVGVALGAALTRRNTKRAEADRLLAEALNDVVASIAEVAHARTSEAQARYASAVSRVALHAPSHVITAFRAFQDDATTGTPDGRARFVAAVQEARHALARGGVGAEELHVLLFGPAPVDGPCTERPQP
jgi:hypothetical protein